MRGKGWDNSLIPLPLSSLLPQLNASKKLGEPGNEVNIHQALSFPFFQKLIPGNLGNVTSV